MPAAIPIIATVAAGAAAACFGVDARPHRPRLSGTL